MARRVDCMALNWAVVLERGFDPLGEGKARGGIPLPFVVAGQVGFFLFFLPRIALFDATLNVRVPQP